CSPNTQEEKVLGLGGLYFLLEPILVREIMTKDPLTIDPGTRSGSGCHHDQEQVWRLAGGQKRATSGHPDGNRFVALHFQSPGRTSKEDQENRERKTCPQSAETLTTAMVNKRSQQRLKQIIESAVSTVCNLPRPGLWFCVDAVATHGHPPQEIRVWATLHFLPDGSPFCCGEPGCHLWLFKEQVAEVAEHVRRALCLRQSVTVDFGDRIRADYHPGIEFRYGSN
ncbi:MAG TPA: hypothetical protein VKE98_19575, partial [Gemmataceae bacterium]|nr:hypothetical protein [Gemmataceae bacterium]